MNLKALSEFLGHSSITITLDRYGHLMPGSQDKAVQLVDAYIERSLAQGLAKGPPERTVKRNTARLQNRRSGVRAPPPLLPRTRRPSLTRLQDCTYLEPAGLAARGTLGKTSCRKDIDGAEHERGA